MYKEIPDNPKDNLQRQKLYKCNVVHLKNNQIEILQIRNKLTYLEIIDGFNSKLGTPTGRITKMEEKLEQTIQGINKTRGNTEERMRLIEHRVGK